MHLPSCYFTLLASPALLPPFASCGFALAGFDFYSWVEELVFSSGTNGSAVRGFSSSLPSHTLLPPPCVLLDYGVANTAWVGRQLSDSDVSFSQLQSIDQSLIERC